MFADDLAQVRGDDRADIHHRVAERLRVLPAARLDPYRLEPEGRVARLQPLDVRGDLPGIDREFPVRQHLALSNRNTLHAQRDSCRAAG